MHLVRLTRRAAVALAALAPCDAIAQQAVQPPVWLEYSANDELERYVRSLQALGDARLQPWSLRPFSPTQLDAVRPAARGPWRWRVDAGDTVGLRAAVVRPRVDVRYNSGFAFGSNDAAVWAGRGATIAASAGAAARWGPLSIAVRPIAFWSQNADFPLTPNGLEGDAAYGDGVFAKFVDRPQRFGDGAYARVDPGQSTIRLDALGVGVGFSTANEWWGPSQEFAFLLSNNAAGFPHVFVGTSKPVNLWVAHAHARLLWGRLEQSAYFVPTGPVMRARRFATGLAVVVTPRGMDNLELGAARFIHAPWPDEGMPGRYVARAFEGIFKRSLPEVDNPIEGDSRSIDGENQLASVFGRLVLPGTGFEVYAEFGREDHPWDLRYLVLSPDEQSALTVGMRKSWRRGADGLAVLRAEAIDFRQSSIDRVRGGRAIYIHASGSNQGHTQRGQLLGADVGVGSASAAIVGLDLYDPRGRTSVEWRRVLRQELPVHAPDGSVAGTALDVMHALTVDRVLFRGAVDLAASVGGVYNFNRNFESDRANLTVGLSVAGLRP